MRISRISVLGLFGRLNHDLMFNPDERITIMFGPNGVGKTMILRIINALFRQSPRALASMPFKQLAVTFDDGSSVTVFTGLTKSKTKKPSKDLRIAYNDGKKEHSFEPAWTIDPAKSRYLFDEIDEIIPSLRQIGPKEWRDFESGETLQFDDVIEQYESELLPYLDPRMVPPTPDWLKEIRAEIPVRFIDTERLTHQLEERRQSPHRHSGRGGWKSQRTVRRFSHDLAERIRDTVSQYGALAQSLDRTFPARLVEEPAKPDFTLDTLRQELADLESKRSKLVEAGLLPEETEGLRISFKLPSLEDVDESKLGVLAVYAQDARKKLSIFDDLYERIAVLTRIANSRFLYKTVKIQPDGLEVRNLDGSVIQLEMLSSGEQHEIVILYELLFRIPDNSFILFDEPELSLHVAWQDKLLEDLEEMAMISKFRVLLATHSPTIIGDRWDLTVELKGPEDKPGG